MHRLLKCHVEKLILDEFGGVVSGESIHAITANLYDHGQGDWCVQWDSREEAQNEVLSILNRLLGVSFNPSWKLDFREGSLVLCHTEPVKSELPTVE